MTLHDLNRGGWEYCAPLECHATILYTAEARTNSLAWDEVSRSCSRALKTAAQNYGWYGSYHSQTDPQDNSLADPLGPYTLRMFTRLPSHILFHTAHTVSRRPIEAMKPLALPEGFSFRDIFQTDSVPKEGCKCGLCEWFKSGDIRPSEEPERVDEVEQVHEEERPRRDEGLSHLDPLARGTETCPGCDDEISNEEPYSTYTDGITGHIWHLSCAITTEDRPLRWQDT